MPLPASQPEVIRCEAVLRFSDLPQPFPTGTHQPLHLCFRLALLRGYFFNGEILRGHQPE
jgi:hypothetical protein